MNVVRYDHTATDLSNLMGGNVLIAGGMEQVGGGEMRTAEIFDTESQTFRPTGAMHYPRAHHRAVPHRSNRLNADVYVFGGPDQASSLVEFYDTTTGRFSDAGSLVTPRRVSFGVDVIGFNVYLVAGGGADGAQTDPASSSAEVFNGGARVSHLVAPMPHARTYAEIVDLPNGSALLTGGPPAADLYDPASQSFTATTGPSIEGRREHTVTLLSDGRVLLVGGWAPSSGGHCVSVSEIFDPATGTFTQVGGLRQPRFGHTSTILRYRDSGGNPRDRVLVVGGVACPQGSFSAGPTGWRTRGLQSVEVFDVTAGTFSNTGDLHEGRWGHTATKTNTGKVLITGGRNGDLIMSGAEIYIPIPPS